MYLQSSHVEVTNLYLGVPTKTTVILTNGTLLPTRFHWGKVSELAPSGTGSAALSTRAHVERALPPVAPQGAPQNRGSPLSLGLLLAPWCSYMLGSLKEQHIWSVFSLPCL